MKRQQIHIEDLLADSNISISHDAILKWIKGKTIFVTGGAGSIGSEIARQLAKYQPKSLVILDQAETPLHNVTLEFENKYPNLDFQTILCDVRNEDHLSHLFKTFKPDIIYHCAAYKHVPMMEKNPCEAVLVNVMGTKILADLAITHGVEKFIFISTDKAVNPTSVMGATKRLAELYLKALASQQKTKFIITRFGNVLGSNGSVFSLFKSQIEQGGPVTITHPDMERYLMSIPDACKLITEASVIGNGGEVFIFDMGQPVKILDLVHDMIRLAGLIPDKDIKIETIGLRPGEKLYEDMLDISSIAKTTSHNKIMMVEEVHSHYIQLEKNIDKIIEVAKDYNSEKTVDSLWGILDKAKGKRDKA